MIVTCPSCGSAFRVRDEEVPASGATLRCTSCQATFQALPPANGGRPAEMVEELRRAREQAELRVLELERTVESLNVKLQATAQRLERTPTRSVPQLDALQTATELQQLVNALPTLHWGLAQTIQYLEPFAADQAILAAHVRQLTLLRNVLERLGQFAKT